MTTLANTLRELAAEFQDDRDYRTEHARFAFRTQLVTAMCNAAAALDEHELAARRLKENADRAARERAAASDELENLYLDTRTLNALRNEMVVTVAQIARTTDMELLRIPNFGRKSLRSLRAVVPYVPTGKPRVRVMAVSQAVMGHA